MLHRYTVNSYMIQINILRELSVRQFVNGAKTKRCLWEFINFDIG